MMNEMNDMNIQKMFPTIVYERGLSYYNNDQVSDLSYDLNNKVWTATVHGTDNYFVEIDLANMSKGSIKAYCECPAFDTYGSCKHNVAVLLSIENQARKSVAEHSYETMNRFIEAITTTKKSELEVLPQQTPMHVEYYCKWSYEKNLYIELRTGISHCYVVRDIRQLLENVMNENEHFFTKSFTYHPDTHYFLQQDLEIFDLLLSILKNEEIYETYSVYSYQQNGGSTKRSLVIPPIMVKSLLTKLIERDFSVELNEEIFPSIELIDGELPFHFSILKDDKDELKLAMPEIANGIYFEPYQLYFSEGIFYFPQREQLPILEQIIQLNMSDHAELPISKDQADVFLSEVLPSLKQVGDIQIEEEIAEEIIQVPLRAKLYLEVKENNWIVGKLEYHYGAYEVDPFTGEKEEEIFIIRDIDKEQQVMRLIEHANFRYNGKELYIASDEEELYDFLYTMLPYIDEHVELFLTNEIKQYIIENEPVPNTNVRLNPSNSLLEIGFSMDDVNDDEVNEILQAIIERKRYYRMHSGAFLSLENEEFSSVKQFLHDLNINKDDLHDGNLNVPIYQSVFVDELQYMNKSYDPSFDKLLQRLKSPEEVVYELPDDLHATLRNYQKAGYQWFKSLSEYHLGGILADDMGLGKTIQSIAYLLSEPSDKPHLIVAPSSVVYNWKNECQRFAPSLQVEILTGTPEERKEKIEAALDKDVWITSYHTLRQDVSIYREVDFQTIILDEAQYVKNYTTKISQAVREVKASRKFALSGTPIENSIEELWSIFQVILPGFMPKLQEFRKMSPDRIAKLAKPFILRRLKSDVLTELPDKIESVHISDLTKDQKDLYVGYLRQLQQEASDSIDNSGFNKNRMKILAGLTRLRQICCHPSLFAENYTGESGKLEQLLEIVRTSIENGKRMLIFSQFTSMHEIIIEHLKEEGIGYFYLHGQTPSEDRVEMSERFNNGEHDVFLISLRAGGTGLNLTGADTVILYDLWWNPAVEDQATGRAHRFGQKNVVQVIRLITEGTIEEKIYDLQQKKRELIDQVIQPGETMLSSLTEDDIRELLSI